MMQIQSLGGAQPVSVPMDNNAARQNAGAAASAASGFSAADVGSLQKKSVSVSNALDKQTAATQEDVDQAVQKINETMQTFSQKLEFSVDKDTESVVVKVVDKDTKEVIRQIPSEELLQIAKALDKLQGLLIKDQA